MFASATGGDDDGDESGHPCVLFVDVQNLKAAEGDEERQKRNDDDANGGIDGGAITDCR